MATHHLCLVLWCPRCVLQVDHIDISDDEFEDAHEHMDMEEDIFGADDAMCRRHQPLSKPTPGGLRDVSLHLMSFKN